MGSQMEYIKKRGFTQNQLKMVAALTMLVDHLGAELFPQLTILRIIGRLAFPIFSYFIYEGFQYTHNKGKYLLRIFLLGILCGVVYYLYSGTLYGNVLITFSFSIIVLYVISTVREWMAKEQKSRLLRATVILGAILVIPGVLAGIYFICQWIYIDYGFWGILLPVFADIGNHMGRKKTGHMPLAGFATGLLILSVEIGGIQYFSLFAIPLLAMYNGKRGSLHMKSFFYWFYPAHLAVVGLLSLLTG